MHNKIKEIINVLNSKKEIIFWTINAKATKRNEKYFIFNDTESYRFVENTNFNINIYKLINEKGEKFIGETSFTIPFNYDLGQIKTIVENANFAGQFVKNKFFEIPSKTYNYNIINNQDALIYSNPDDAINKIRQTIENIVSKENKIKLSANEIFVSNNQKIYIDSNKNEYSFNDTDILLEFVLLGGNNLEVETHYLTREKFIENLNLEETIEQYIKYTLDNQIAKLPESGKFDVVFSGDALVNFFDFHLFHSSAQSFYNKASIFKIGKPIDENVTGDKLSLYSDPFLKGGTKTKISDNFGTPLKKFTLIEENVLKNIASDTRYSYYLNCKNTGPITNIVVKNGNTSLNDLKMQENTFYLTRFSTFSPNSMTGAFSGEIRSGYFYKNGKFYPVKGGSVTGSIQEVFKNILFSKETIKKGSYSGPKGIKVFNVDVAGN